MAAFLLAGLYALVGWLRPGWVLDAEYARLRWLAGAQEHTLVAAGHRWRYVESGEGPLVVLVHGFTGMKENWLPLMRELRADHRVVAPDLPGWGESERIAGAGGGAAVGPRRAAPHARYVGEARVAGRPLDGRADRRPAGGALAGSRRADRADGRGGRALQGQWLRS